MSIERPPRIVWKADELERVLALAHRTMDTLGYPPANRTGPP